MKSGTRETGPLSMSCMRRTMSTTIRTTPIKGPAQKDSSSVSSGYRSVLHGFDLRIERQIAEGDMVETHWSLRGTHGGPLEGTDPTGKSLYVDGQLLSRIVDGKFVKEWVHWDTLGLLRQIGAVSPPSA